MNDLKKQVAKPLVYYKGHPSKYNRCPKCPGIKDKASESCRACRLRANRPPVILSTVYVDFAPCRMIPLTHGHYTIVDARDYDMLMRYSWHARYSRHSGNWYTWSQERGTQKPITMHGLLLNLPIGRLGDHANLDTLDNRRVNLRAATTSQSNSNTRQLIRSNTSGYRGVSWKKERGLWDSYIRCNGRLFFLGRFSNPVDAAKARDAAAVRLHGEFARLNFPKV